MSRPRRAARWLALALCTSATLFFVFMLLGYAIGGDEGAVEDDAVGEGIAVVCGALILTAATVSAWLRARLAWAALLIAAAVFATIIALTAGTNVLLVVVLLPAPWYLAGILLWAGRDVAVGDRPSRRE